MTQTESKFQKHNHELMKNLIPGHKEMPSANFYIDPKYEIFYKSFETIIWEAKQQDKK